MQTIFCIICIIYLQFLHAESPFGGEMLDQALKEIVDPMIQRHGGSGSDSDGVADSFWAKNSKDNTISKEMKSTLRRRCSNYLACEHHVPVVEIENAIFYDGSLYLNNPDHETLKSIRDMNKIYASHPNYLPSSLVQSPKIGKDKINWMPGPPIIVYNASDPTWVSPKGFLNINSKSGVNSVNDIGGPKTCDKKWDTSAYFLFPWETKNAYHALNDNVLSVLASVVLQYLTDGMGNRINPKGEQKHVFAKATHKTLFMFGSAMKGPIPPSPTMNILNTLFQGDIQSPSELLRPPKMKAAAQCQCVRRVVWGSAFKPFYKDGLYHLRRTIHAVLRRVLQLSYGEAIVPSLSSISMNKKAKAKAALTTIKVLIISRGSGTTVLNQDGRKRTMVSKSETDLVKAFHNRNNNNKNIIFEVSKCCNFGEMKKPEKLIQTFAKMDVCMGVHGAGLSNCIWGPPNMLVFEFQAMRFTYFGFDSYIKIAHMTGGNYAAYIPHKIENTENGMELQNNTIQNIVSTVLLLVTTPKDLINTNANAGTDTDSNSNSNSNSNLEVVAEVEGLGRQASIKRHIIPAQHGSGSKLKTEILIIPPVDDGIELNRINALQVLGPLGSTDTGTGIGTANDKTSIIPYYSAAGYRSTLSYNNYCKRLPYYAFRTLTRARVIAIAEKNKLGLGKKIDNRGSSCDNDQILIKDIKTKQQKEESDVNIFTSYVAPYLGNFAFNY